MMGHLKSHNGKIYHKENWKDCTGFEEKKDKKQTKFINLMKES